MKKIFKKRFSNYTFVGRKYKDEFRKQMRMIITFTLGFSIAFAWRETIFEWAKTFVSNLTHSSKSGNAWASILITLISVTLIVFTTYWLKDRNPYR